MKTPTVAELEPRQQVTGLFLVQSKEVRQKKTGEPYLSLTFMDRTGDIDAKMWDNVADVMETFDRDDFVRVKGETLLYQNKLQLTVHRLQKVDERDVDIADFLPASARDAEEMFAELMGIISGMGNPHLRALLEAIFADADVAEAFKKAPAAKSIHHAWLGGLLEHVLSLATLARFASKHYQHIDEDLLMAGVVLHDIGKIYELSYGRSFGYTTEGQLLGHIQMALRLIGDKLPPAFPPKLRDLLEHMVLSHHGQLEFGSPKLPVFPEALLLHHLDNMDSKMELIRSVLDRDKNPATVWSSYVPALERSVLNKNKYMAPPAPAANANVKPAPSKSQKQTVMGEKMAAIQSLFGEENS